MLSLGRENDISKAQFQAHLLDDIFRVGCFSQLIWFQKSLKYLSKDKLNEKKRILVAVKGDKIFYSFHSIWNIILIIIIYLFG